MTLNGLWTGEFASTEGSFGGAVLLVQESRIAGGDSGYYFTGTLTIQSNDSTSLTGQVVVKPFIEGHKSIFNTHGLSYTLQFQAKRVTSDVIVGQGFPVELPASTISFRLTRREYSFE